VHIPAVLPLAGLVSEIEAPPQLRKSDADRQRRVAEAVVARVGTVLARIFEIDRKRRAPREDETGGPRGDLVAELGGAFAVVLLVRLGERIDEVAE
jgi:hypothetical protein